MFLSAVDQSNNIADIMGESKGEDEKEAESEEVRIKSSYRQPDLKFVGTVGTGGPVKFFLAV